MGYRSQFGVLERRRSSQGLLALAREAVDSETVNDVLVSVAAAGASYWLKGTNGPLETAYKAGWKVGRRFRKEAERVFREFPLPQRVGEEFEKEAYKTEDGTDLRYTREGDHALILVGDNGCYVENGNNFKEFLIGCLGFRPESVLDLFTMADGNPRNAPKVLRESSRRVIGKTGKFGNCVVYYSGCGDDGCFAFAGDRIEYNNWIEPFSRHRGNVVFVIDTACASSMKIPLEKFQVLPKRGMLLSGAADSTSFGNGFSAEIISNYRGGRPYYVRNIEIQCDAHRAVQGIAKFLGAFSGNDAYIPIPPCTQKHVQIPEKVGDDLDYLLLNFDAKKKQEAA